VLILGFGSRLASLLGWTVQFLGSRPVPGESPHTPGLARWLKRNFINKNIFDKTRTICLLYSPRMSALGGSIDFIMASVVRDAERGKSVHDEILTVAQASLRPSRRTFLQFCALAAVILGLPPVAEAAVAWVAAKRGWPLSDRARQLGMSDVRVFAAHP